MKTDNWSSHACCASSARLCLIGLSCSFISQLVSSVLALREMISPCQPCQWSDNKLTYCLVQRLVVCSQDTHKSVNCSDWWYSSLFYVSSMLVVLTYCINTQHRCNILLLWCLSVWQKRPQVLNESPSFNFSRKISSHLGQNIYISARSVIASTFWSLALHESNSLGLYELYGGTYL